MAETPFVESKIYGFFEPTFVPTGRVSMRIEQPAPGMLLETPDTRIHDARCLQEREQREGSASEAVFFAEHGFVLLSHESAVEDWDVDPTTPQDENPLMRVYLPEIEALIRSRLLPDRRLEIWQGPPQRRGPGTANPSYAGGAHQDFGLSPDDYQEGMQAFTGPEIGAAWRSRFEQDDVAGFMMIDFWRTAGMQEPLKHMPLSVCDPRTVRIEDVVPLAVLDITPTGLPTNQLSLRFHPDQRWYYYPEMTPHELLAFKNFQYFKDAPEASVETCFHSAFEDPGTPPDAEVRQSSEHRVSVFLLKD